LIIYPKISECNITLPFETTFDCDEWEWDDGALSCDGILKNLQGHEQIIAEANYPGGKGVNGQRHNIGPCNICQSCTGGGGGLYYRWEDSDKVNEIWMRFYTRFEAGWKWESWWAGYKQLYFYDTGGSGFSYFLMAQGNDSLRMYQQNGNREYLSCTNCGWMTWYPAGVSDGSWYCLELHLKMETSSAASDGILQVWLDGELVIDVDDTDYGVTDAGRYIRGVVVGSNISSGTSQFDPEKCMAIDYDDIVINRTGYIGPINNGKEAKGSILFKEDFDDADLESKGWYDNTDIQLSSDEHISGSTSSAEFQFIQGDTKPLSGSAMRRKFTDTDEVYVSYFVKYSSNWEGSNKPYHPHEFYLLTNVDGDWTGPASTHLTAYIEQNEGVPLLSIQDAQNIDESKIGVDLTHVTENRAVAGCNGNGDCYQAGSSHNNGIQWKAGNLYFQDNPGQYYKSDWHFIEAYFKLNTISGGKGVADGQIKYWYDGTLIIDHNDVMMRTARHPDMKFNQFLIGPYIGDGSPVDQTFWIDNLIVATSRIQDTGSPESQTGLTTDDGLQMRFNTSYQTPEVVWLMQGVDLTKHTKGPFTVKIRVEGIDKQKDFPIYPRIRYYIGTGSSHGYFEMIHEGDSVWRFDIPDPNWYKYRSNSLHYQVKLFDEEGAVISESRWEVELIDSFTQQD
jgi:hypothetical protein